MNLSNIVSRRELHSKAEKYCLSAHRRFLKLGENAWLTMAENSLANTYAELNDFPKAEGFYLRALENAKSSKMFVTEAEIEASLGNLAKFRGKLDQALNFLELSRRKFEDLKMPHQRSIAALEIADIYLELNLADEAISIYEKTAKEFRKLKLQGEEARARVNLAKSALILGETRKARTELKKSARLYLSEQNKVGAAIVKLNESLLELNLFNFENALKLAGEAIRLLKRTENHRHELTAKWLCGEARRELRQFSKAGKLLRETYRGAIAQEQRNIALLSLNSLGKIARETGENAKAIEYFQMACDLVETLRAPLPAEEFRMAFLAGKLESYENLARIYLTEKDFAKALYFVEIARSRSLADTIDINFKVEDRSEASKTLYKTLDSVREELNWLYSRLNRAEGEETASLQDRIKNNEKKIADLIRRIESTKIVKTGSAFENTSVFDVGELQRQLGEKKILVDFVKFGENFSAFIVSESEISFVENIAAESEILECLEGLHFQFGALRFGTRHLKKFLPELKRRAEHYLGQLYEKLVKPLEDHLAATGLIIVPSGALHYVPFHALFRKGKYLIEDFEITYSPGASVWQKLEAKPAKEFRSALLFGFADEQIPLVDKEIESLRPIFGSSKAFSGNAASFANFNSNAPDFDIVHIACHGQFRPENPMFSSLHLSDGYITVRDLCLRKFSAGLVTLSACETGLNKIFAGDEILGLARGFLSAGASSLVLSLWTVNDEAAAALMKDFYLELQRGKTVSASLRKAQTEFIGKRMHPYFWSPFAAVGK